MITKKKTHLLSLLLLLISFCALLFPRGASANQIACTEAALHTEIARINEDCSSLSQASKTVTFNCAAGTVIPIKEAIGDRSRDEYCDVQSSSWEKGTAGCSSCAPTSVDPKGCTLPSYEYLKTRVLTCGGTVIDGGNKVTFELSPGCDDRLIQQGKPWGCTEYEGGDQIFQVNADDIVLKNFAYKYFWEGIQAAEKSENLFLDNVVGSRSCDDSFSSFVGSGPHIVIKNSRFEDGCDKCVQLNGRDVGTTAYPDYDVQVLDNVFDNCETPLAPADGRYLVEGNIFKDTNPNADWCHGPYVGHYLKMGSDPVVYWKDNVLQNCRQGLRIDGNGKLVSLGGNVFQNNRHRGVAVTTNAKALFQCDTFQNNGGDPTGWGDQLLYGGVAVSSTAELLLGGPGTITIDKKTFTSAGGNTFIGNKSPTDSTLDINNSRASQAAAVGARGNWFGSASSPSGKIFGNVDFTPWLTSVPTACAAGGAGGSGDITPPAPPTGLIAA